MRVPTITISENNLMYCIAGQLYYQAPARRPRKADKIMQKVCKQIRKDFYNDNEYYTLRIESEKVYEYIEKLLLGIPQFCELNLSQDEYDKHIKVDDPNRSKVSFVSRYDVETKDSWRGDFIDLDAFIRNVVRQLNKIMDWEADCYFCKRDGDQEKKDNCSQCKVCTVNPCRVNYFEASRIPKGKYTISCSYDCYKSYQICCTECDERDTCEKKCGEDPVQCDNVCAYSDVNGAVHTEDAELGFEYPGKFPPIPKGEPDKK